eukprot:scaffold5604_cov78-Phaeocystis_antarctica.AAC.2
MPVPGAPGVTLNAGVTPVTNLTTIRARRLVTVAGDAVCYVVVCKSRRVGSSGTRVLRLQLVLRSAALLACCCYWAHELFPAQKRCDVRLARLLTEAVAARHTGRAHSQSDRHCWAGTLRTDGRRLVRARPPRLRGS